MARSMVVATPQQWKRVEDAMNRAMKIQSLDKSALVERGKRLGRPFSQSTVEALLGERESGPLVDGLQGRRSKIVSSVSQALWGDPFVIERVLDGEDAPDPAPPSADENTPPWVRDVLAASRGTAEGLALATQLLDRLAQNNDRLVREVGQLAQTIERRLSA